MKVGKGRVASIKQVTPRTYADGKTTTRAILGYENWSIDTPERIDGRAFFSCGVLTLPEGGEVAAHSHSGREEIYFILEGSGEATIDGETCEVGEGMALWFPAKTMHRMYNPNKQPLKMFFSTATTEPGHMSHD